MTVSIDRDAAKTFILTHARLIDRLRFSFLFEGGSSARVIDALVPYQNDDGGFGNALEPDLRGSESQPIPVWAAFGIIAECSAFSHPMVERACSYLATITTGDGGVPFVLSTVDPSPHAPWWVPEPIPSASLNPTAGLVAYLHGHHVNHPWLAPADAYCWQALDQLDATSPYELATILAFLDATPDRDRAEATFLRIAEIVKRQDFITLDPDATGEVHFPLAFASSPTSLGRRLFSDDVIEAHLDALVRQQQSDGGWTVNWTIWTPLTEHEWRGVRTLDVLGTLQRYGRL